MEVPSVKHSSTAGRPAHAKSCVIYELNIMLKQLSKCIKKLHSYTVTRFFSTQYGLSLHKNIHHQIYLSIRPCKETQMFCVSVKSSHRTVN